MEPTYEVWTFDGRRPELLSGGHPDKGVCRRAWRLSTHAAIVRDGVVLEPKPTCDAKKARAIASAAAEAHRAATGSAPTLAFVGPVNGDGKRALEMDTRGKGSRLAALATAAEPMPAKHTPPPEEVIPAVEPVARPVPFDESPEAVVVVTRKPVPAIAPEKPMPSTTTGRCPCGEPSAPTAGAGGRPSTPEWTDLCTDHRNRAMGRRRRTGESAAVVRLWSLGVEAAPPAASKPTSKPRPSKPAPVTRSPKARAAEAPVSDLLAIVRRQRTVVDALGGIDQAERVAAACARVGGAAALVQLVDELARTVA